MERGVSLSDRVRRLEFAITREHYIDRLVERLIGRMGGGNPRAVRVLVVEILEERARDHG